MVGVRTKFLVLILYCIVFVSVSLFFPSCHLLADSDSSLSYIRRITGLSLPSHISVISEFDQGELEMGGKYQIEKRTLRGF